MTSMKMSELRIEDELLRRLIGGVVEAKVVEEDGKKTHPNTELLQGGEMMSSCCDFNFTTCWISGSVP